MIKMKPITVCDKCNTEIDEPIVSFDNMDFCKGCYLELFGMISDWIADEPIEIEVPDIFEEKPIKTMTEIKSTPNKDGSKKVVKTSTCGRAKGIDWDKACALKLAGRSNAWIADELGCKASTVSAEIYKKLESYKIRKKQEEEEAKRKILAC